MSEEIKETTEETTEVQEEVVQDRVFPISALVGCLKGEAADAGVLEMLSYITQSDVDTDLAPVAAGLSKGFIYEQEPGLTSYKSQDIAALGSKVKLAPLAGDELSQAQAVLAVLTELKAEAEGLKAKIAELEKEKSALEGEISTLQAKVKVADAANASGESKITLAAGKIDDMVKKLEALQAEVEKVKSQGVVVAGAAGGGGEGAAAGGEAMADGPKVGGEPEGDFGLGSDAFGGDW